MHISSKVQIILSYLMKTSIFSQSSTFTICRLCELLNELQLKCNFERGFSAKRLFFPLSTRQMVASC